MLRKSLVPIVVAVVFGLGAALFAHSWMQNRIAAAEAHNRGGVPVVVATTDISFGEKIGADQVKVVGWPDAAVPQEALRSTEEAVGKIATQRLVAGEPILRERVSSNAGGSSLSAMVEPNKRAITVRVNDVIGVAGFLLPGNRVDVLATRISPTSRHAETHTILQNLKVLAVDQTSQTQKDQPVVVRAVTVEVDPSQAEALVRSTEEGTVQLALRNPDDHMVAALSQPQTMTDAAPTAVPEAAPAAPAAPAPAPAVAATPTPKRHRHHAEHVSGASSVTIIRQAQVGHSKPQLENSGGDSAQ